MSEFLIFHTELWIVLEVFLKFPFRVLGVQTRPDLNHLKLRLKLCFCKHARGFLVVALKLVLFLDSSKSLTNLEMINDGKYGIKCRRADQNSPKDSPANRAIACYEKLFEKRLIGSQCYSQSYYLAVARH